MTESRRKLNARSLLYCNSGSEQWRCVGSILNGENVDFEAIHNSLGAGETVIKELLENKFVDMFFVSRVIDVLSSVRNTRFRQFERDFSAETDMEQFVKVLGETLEEREESGNFFYLPELEFKQLDKVMFHGDADLMQVLVRYGISGTSPPLMKSEMFQECRAVVTQTDSDISSEYLKRLKRNVMILIPDAFTERYKEDIRRFGFFLPGPTGIKRELLAKAAVQTVQMQDEVQKAAAEDLNSPIPDHVMCLRLFYQITTEPHLSDNEILSHLRRSVKNEKVLGYILKVVKRSIPEVQGDYCPRSLKHLSRCQVRLYYRRFGALPNVVSGFLIPDSVKNYILINSCQQFE